MFWLQQRGHTCFRGLAETTDAAVLLGGQSLTTPSYKHKESLKSSWTAGAKDPQKDKYYGHSTPFDTIIDFILNWEITRRLESFVQTYSSEGHLEVSVSHIGIYWDIQIVRWMNTFKSFQFFKCHSEEAAFIKHIPAGIRLNVLALLAVCAAPAAKGQGRG